MVQSKDVNIVHMCYISLKTFITKAQSVKQLCCQLNVFIYTTHNVLIIAYHVNYDIHCIVIVYIQW